MSTESLATNLSIFTDPTFWVGASFIIFVAIMAKPVGKFITNSLDTRTNNIQNEIDEALRLKEEAQSLLASYQRKQKEIETEAKNIVAHAEEEVKLIKEKAEKELEENLNTRIEMAMQKIARYENSVLQDVRNNAIDIAIASVKSLITQHTTQEIAEDLIGDAISDLDRKLN